MFNSSMHHTKHAIKILSLLWLRFFVKSTFIDSVHVFVQILVPIVKNILLLIKLLLRGCEVVARGLFYLFSIACFVVRALSTLGQYRLTPLVEPPLIISLCDIDDPRRVHALTTDQNNVSELDPASAVKGSLSHIVHLHARCGTLPWGWRAHAASGRTTNLECTRAEL